MNNEFFDENSLIILKTALEEGPGFYSQSIGNVRRLCGVLMGQPNGVTRGQCRVFLTDLQKGTSELNQMIAGEISSRIILEHVLENGVVLKTKTRLSLTMYLAKKAGLPDKVAREYFKELCSRVINRLYPT